MLRTLPRPKTSGGGRLRAVPARLKWTLPAILSTLGQVRLKPCKHAALRCVAAHHKQEPCLGIALASALPSPFASFAQAAVASRSHVRLTSAAAAASGSLLGAAAGCPSEAALLALSSQCGRRKS
eukprot:361196-Chlamydomonas_euryale.AAC.6